MFIQPELKQLVSKSVKLLGQALCEIYGEGLYLEIEALRQAMKKVRGKSPVIVQKALETVYLELQMNASEELRKKAKAFSLMLELINSCEAAYRSHRLARYQVKPERKPHAIIYVFTSHPTESRSQKFLKLMSAVEELLIDSFDQGFEEIQKKLSYYLKIAVRLNLANNRRPQVKDEMEQIFHIVLDPAILKEQLSLNKKDLNVSFRTWVGGDKDGHPKVGSATMLESFNLSRQKLLFFIEEELKQFEKEVTLIGEGDFLRQELRTFKQHLKNLKKISSADGKKVVRLKKSLSKLKSIAEAHQMLSPFICDIEKLLWFFPALVLPLEIREDSGRIKNALSEPSEPILAMLSTLKKISQGLDAKWYVRGFVISMCQTAEDLIAAMTITKKRLGDFAIPVIPLFENEEGLVHGTTILNEAFKQYAFPEEHHKRWGSRFEVMVGYSDSSKENGVLPARLMIEKALFELEKFLLKKKLVPVFFHGSGGSTSRGGGTVHEQISWWPQSALNIFKVTIQGEMVQRNFNNPLIMRSQIGKVVEGCTECQSPKWEDQKDVQLFARGIQEAYRELVHDPAFQKLTMLATPYDYLNLLKIGSRPTKRAAKGIFSLRAIPWILCWTQTRLLLPIWWGTGVSWSRLSETEKKKVKRYYQSSPLMHSYIKNLGFTLAKVELGVWNFHLEHSDLAEEEKSFWRKKIMEEFNLSVNFFHELTDQQDFTWFRPWLGESIFFRSSMIHPLNIIQKLALERNDHILLRETVTGIASGMLTTG